MSITPSPPPDASDTARGLVSLLAQTFAGVKTFTSKLVAAAGIELSSLWNTNGTGASDVGVKVGVTTADASVNAAAHLLEVSTGIGATEVKKFWVSKVGPTVAGGAPLELNGDGGGVRCLFSSGTGVAGLFNSAGSLFLGINMGTGLALCSGGFAAPGEVRAGYSAGGGTSQAVLTATGRLDQSGTDSSGTPGSRTGANAINKPSGKSAIAAGATTCQIDNSLVAAGDQVFITWHGDLGTQSKVPWVTTAAGSFTVNVGTAPAGAVAFCWAVQKRI